MAEQQETSSLHFLDYWRVIRSRKEIVLAVTLLVVITGTAFTFTLPKKFAASTRILVREDVMSVDVFENQLYRGYDPFFLRTQERIIRSKPVLNQVVHNLNLQQVWGEKYNDDGSPLNKNQAYSLLSSEISIEQERDTSLIEIRVEDENPDLAARIANEIATVYRDQRLSLKRREVQRGLDVLQNELQKQQERVEVAEDDLERIREELGVSQLSQGYRVDKIRLQQLEADRIASRVDMLTRKARFDQVETMTVDDLVDASSFIVPDSTIAGIRQQLIDTEVSLRVMLENMGENHPDVRRLAAAVDELRKKLNAALIGVRTGLRADYEVARAKYEALENELRAAKMRDIEDEKKRFLPFDKAEQKVELQRNILAALRARITQEGIEVEVPRTPVEIIDTAEPNPRPVSPKLVLNILLSLIVGLAAGIGLAYFIEYLDTSVRTVDDIEKLLGLPVLGVIPQKVRPLVEEGPESHHAESYRVLRTNMQFANKGVRDGAFAVVSGGVGEGKSTTLFNLAYVCAQSGERVLLVDSDMRRPVQHTILHSSNKKGLIDVLSKGFSLDEAMVPTSVPNLFFLPSGKSSRSSLGILNSQKLRELVTDLKQRFDVVLFDTPPIMGITDASILSSEMDGVLLVIQYRKYPKALPLRAKRMVENVGGTILGVVMNNINIMRDDYYYYYHTSYYDYSSGRKEADRHEPEPPAPTPEVAPDRAPEETRSDTEF